MTRTRSYHSSLINKLKNNKLKKIILSISAVALLLVSCGKTCRCYRYDGNVDEFDMEEIKADSTTCAGKELIDFGLTYSLCETVTF